MEISEYDLRGYLNDLPIANIYPHNEFRFAIKIEPSVTPYAGKPPLIERMRHTEIVFIKKGHPRHYYWALKI